MQDTHNANELQVYEFKTLDVMTNEERAVKVACGYHNTDEGNAQRFLAHCHDDARYCQDAQTWFIWDGSKWAPDTTGMVYEFAKDVVRLIHAEAAFIEGENRNETKELRKAVNQWAFKSEALVKIKAMVELAKTDARIATKMSDFNTNPWLINCPNGTLDLMARELREPRREDLITKVAAVPYEPETNSAAWYERLLEVLSLRQGAFLQRAAGSALTAINRDKALFVLYGKPNARKSTLLDAIFKTFGDYALPVDISTFAKVVMRPGGARADIVSLEGIRAAQCSEVPQGMVFNDAFLKAMTGANPRSARALYEKSMRKIVPVTKFFIETNFLPRINFDDEAAFNRFFIVTFLNTIPLEDCDATIKEFLLEDEDAQKAIFAWLVQGCYDWQDSGLIPPDSVNAARVDYQKSMNPLASFIASEVIEEDEATVSTRALYEAFKGVATPEERHNVPNLKSFGAYLTRLGFENRHAREGSLRVGIRLRGLNEFEEEEEAQNEAGDECDECEAYIAKVPMNITKYHETLHKHPSHSSQRHKELEGDLNEIVDNIEHYQEDKDQEGPKE